MAGLSLSLSRINFLSFSNTQTQFDFEAQQGALTPPLYPSPLNFLLEAFNPFPMTTCSVYLSFRLSFSLSVSLSLYHNISQHIPTQTSSWRRQFLSLPIPLTQRTIDHRMRPKEVALDPLVVPAFGWTLCHVAKVVEMRERKRERKKMKKWRDEGKKKW